jgi:hypothetical protein
MPTSGLARHRRIEDRKGDLHRALPQSKGLFDAALGHREIELVDPNEGKSSWLDRMFVR